MSKNRYINTKFWSDPFIVELNSLDRYLFLYLLTNEHTNICGVYELSWKVMARETGIDDEMLQNIFKRLEGKIFYIDGWIFIKNFFKHQADNESVRKGIEISMKNVPAKILAKISDINTACDSMGTACDSLGTDCDIYKYKSKPKPKTKLEPKPKRPPDRLPPGGGGGEQTFETSGSVKIGGTDGATQNPEFVKRVTTEEIQEVLNVFYYEAKANNIPFNFGDKRYRGAAEELILAHGKDQVIAVAEEAIRIRKIDPYIPAVVNILDLKEKWPKLIAYGEKKAIEPPKKKWVVTIG